MSAPKDAIGNKLAIGQRVALSVTTKDAVGYVTEIKEPSKILGAMIPTDNPVRNRMPPQMRPGTVKVIVEYTIQYMDEGPNIGIPGVFALRRPPAYTGPDYIDQNRDLGEAKKVGEAEAPPTEATTPTESN